MKRMLLVLLFTLVYSVSLPSVCLAQFQNHFNVYRTDSLDSTHTVIFQQITIDGYSTVPGGMPPGVLHTPKILNTLGSTGGWSTGTGVCPSCHITYSTTVGLTFSQGTFEPGSDDTQVQCPWGGTFFNGGDGGGGTSSFQIEIAYTRAISKGTQYNCYWNQAITQEVCTIAAQPWCTAATSPPDWPVSGIDSQVYPPPAPNWWEAWGICVNYGTPGFLILPWICAPNGFALEQYTAIPSPASCTHNQ